jgi:hypothetical protein
MCQLAYLSAVLSLTKLATTHKNSIDKIEFGS